MASEKILNQKKSDVAELVEKFQKAKSVVLTDYRGITVEEDTKLRNDLRKANVEYKVIKNSIMSFAAKEAGLADLENYFAGPSAIALCYDDPVAPAKVLVEYAKKNEKYKLKAGVVDGNVIGEKEIKALAELPSKEVLIAKVLGGLNAPITGFVNVLNGNIRGLAVALNAIREKKANAGA